MRVPTMRWPAARVLLTALALVAAGCAPVPAIIIGVAAMSGGGGGGGSDAEAVPAARITVDPTTIPFGLVAVSSSRDLAFTVTNDGNATLSGTATTAPPFSIVGGGTYSLTTGTSQVVTVRFAPSAGGAASGSVSCSGGGGASVALSGSGDPLPSISLTGGPLDFDTVPVGASADRSFTVRNQGGQTLSGAASTSAPFSIVGGGSYALAAGQSQTVTVRFTPTATGPASGNVVCSGGGGGAVGVSGDGEPAPSIEVTPTALAFGPVTVSTTSDLPFMVRNSGGGTLTGTATVSPPFSIVSGGAYSLGAGLSQTVTARFSPTSTAGASANVTCSGGGGAIVALSGNGDPLPALGVTPTSISFGTVPVGSSADIAFTVTNTGGGTLVGVATTSAPFLITGGASYNLTAGQGKSITVRFTPGVGGTASASVTCTGGGGAVFALSGTGDPLPSIFVTPTALAFGLVTVSTTAELTFEVKNGGGQTLSGTATTSAPFSIVNGGTYSLGAGQSQTVTARFGPTVVGTVTGSINLSGGINSSLGLSGTGSLSGQYLFWVDATSSSIRRARPDGSELLSLTSNTNAWGLAVDSRAERVIWTSHSDGTISSMAFDGSARVDRTVGSSPLGLALDLIHDKLYWTQSANLLRSNLDGSGQEALLANSSVLHVAVAPLAGFVFWSEMNSPALWRAKLDMSEPTNLNVGGSPYALAVDEPLGRVFWADNQSSQIRSVLFDGSDSTLVWNSQNTTWLTVDEPGRRLYWTDGNFSKIRWRNLGASGSGDFQAPGTPRGIGVATDPSALPRASVTPTALDFGSVSTTADMTFTVTNSGGGTLVGTASAIGDFSIFGLASYALASGQSQIITVRFTASSSDAVTGSVTLTGGGGVTVSLSAGTRWGEFDWGSGRWTGQ